MLRIVCPHTLRFIYIYILNNINCFFVNWAFLTMHTPITIQVRLPGFKTGYHCKISNLTYGWCTFWKRVFCWLNGLILHNPLLRSSTHWACKMSVRDFELDHTWTGAMTAHGPPSNCSSAVCSFSLKTNPVKKTKTSCQQSNPFGWNCSEQ